VSGVEGAEREDYDEREAGVGKASEEQRYSREDKKVHEERRLYASSSVNLLSLGRKFFTRAWPRLTVSVGSVE